MSTSTPLFCDNQAPLTVSPKEGIRMRTHIIKRASLPRRFDSDVRSTCMVSKNLDKMKCSSTVNFFGLLLHDNLERFLLLTCIIQNEIIKLTIHKKCKYRHIVT